MKRIILDKICTVILFAAGFVLSWGGVLYAAKNPEHFKPIGVLIAFVGYGIYLWAVLRYENEAEEQV